MTRIRKADARKVPLDDGVAACAVMSPPYLNQRVYGDSANEIGLCASVAEYVEQMVDVGKEVARYGDDRVTWWLNIGDKANDSGGAGGDHNKGGSKAFIPHYGHFYDRAYPKGTLLDVPSKVVDGLQRDGWIMRSRITWDKGRPKPEDLAHVKRPLYQTEVIFMLTRVRSKYRWHPEALASFGPADRPEKGDVWRFPPGQPLGNQHYAPFPDELPRRCILLSSDEGELVVDPFAGSGTTLRVAEQLGRQARGFDLYPATRARSGGRSTPGST